MEMRAAHTRKASWEAQRDESVRENGDFAKRRTPVQHVDCPTTRRFDVRFSERPAVIRDRIKLSQRWWSSQLPQSLLLCAGDDWLSSPKGFRNVARNFLSYQALSRLKSGAAACDTTHNAARTKRTDDEHRDSPRTILILDRRSGSRRLLGIHSTLVVY